MIDDNTEIFGAVFMNDEQTIVQVFAGNKQTKTTFAYDIDIVNGDPYLWQQLLQRVSVERIHEMTEDYHLALERMRAEQVANYAKNNKLVFEPGTWQPSNKIVLEHIFDLPEGDVGSDLLFEIKLRAFDIPKVAESTNLEYKTKIREAESALDVFYWVGKITNE